MRKITDIFKKIQRMYTHYHASAIQEYLVFFLIGMVAVLTIFLVITLIQFKKTKRAHIEFQDLAVREMRQLALNQSVFLDRMSFFEQSSEIGFEHLRTETEERLIAARDEIEDARTSIQETLAIQSGQLRSTIRTWSPRIPLVRCTFAQQMHTGQTQFVTTRGAGTLFRSDGSLRLVTNRHIIEEAGYILQTCALSFGDETPLFIFGADAVQSQGTSLDIAFVDMTNAPEVYIQRSASIRSLCEEPALAGDQIIIMGYPSIGAESTVTVTEGIISGYEGDYYITSAKVERGNSGGAAILVRENCYLGIPTFVASGRIESLARILDARVIY
ncbi:MAG: serine protease [Candidatus Pacebacteria bacterium]|nr:serine protease [Candidatus Paceibacterota bacterium]